MLLLHLMLDLLLCLVILDLILALPLIMMMMHLIMIPLLLLCLLNLPQSAQLPPPLLHGHGIAMQHDLFPGKFGALHGLGELLELQGLAYLLSLVDQLMVLLLLCLAVEEAGRALSCGIMMAWLLLMVVVVVVREGGRAVRRGVGAHGHIADACLTWKIGLLRLLLALHGRIKIDLVMHPKVLLLLMMLTLVPLGLIIAIIAEARKRKHVLLLRTAAADSLLNRMKVHAVQRAL